MLELLSMESCTCCSGLNGGRCSGCVVKAGDKAMSDFLFDKACDLYAISHPADDKYSNLLLSVHLATCLRETAKYHEAEITLLHGIERVEKSGLDSIVLDSIEKRKVYARALTALATLYQAQSRYAAAIKLHEKAVALARNILDCTNLFLAEIISGYAESLRKSGDLPQAESFHREALEIRSMAFDEHLCTELDLAVSYTQLGCTLAGMNQFGESYKYHDLALKLRYRHLDFPHGLISESMNYCAESLFRIGRGVEGIPLAIHSCQARKQVFSETHPAYAHSLSVLASCYHSVGRFLDAENVLQTV